MAEIVDLARRRPRIELSVEPLFLDLLRQTRTAADERAAIRAAFREFARVLVALDVTTDEVLDAANLVVRDMRKLLDHEPDGAA